MYNYIIIYIQINNNYYYKAQYMYNNYIIIYILIIREYGSTLYVGMARKKNGCPYISIVNGKLESLVIYTNKLKCT